MSLNGAVARAVWGGGVDLSGTIDAHYALNEVTGTRAESHVGIYSLIESGGAVGSADIHGHGVVSHFTSASGHLTADKAVANLGSGDWHTCGWIRKRTSIDANFLWGTGISWHVGAHNYAITAQIFTGSGYVNLTRLMTVFPGLWYFVELWRSGGTVYLDVNKSGVPESAVASVDYASDSIFRVGKYAATDVTADHYITKISMFAGYVPTEKERSVLYNGRHGTSYSAVASRTILIGTPGTPSTEAERYAEAIWDYTTRQVSDPAGYGQYLRLYLKADETGTSPVREDEHGTGDAVPYSLAVGHTTGKIGNAVDSPGDDRGLSIPGDYVPTGDVSIAVACWVKQDTLNHSYATILCKYKSGSQQEFILGIDPTVSRFYVAFSANGSSDTLLTYTGVTVSNGTWYRVVFWHDPVANQINLAVNGVAATPVSHSGGIFDGTANLLIGARSEFNNNGGFDGQVDEIAVLYDLTPDSAFLAWDYNSSTGRTYEEWGAVAAGGGEDITGTLSATLDDATIVSTATVLIQSNLSRTLDDATVVSAATVLVQSTLSQTLSNATIVSTATVLIQSNLSRTLDDATVTSTIGDSITGTLNVTLDNVTLSSHSLVHNVAIFNKTLDDATLTSNANVNIVGTLNVTLADATMLGSITQGDTPSRLFNIFGSSIFVE